MPFHFFGKMSLPQTVYFSISNFWYKLTQPNICTIVHCTVRTCFVYGGGVMPGWQARSVVCKYNVAQNRAAKGLIHFAELGILFIYDCNLLGVVMGIGMPANMESSSSLPSAFFPFFFVAFLASQIPPFWGWLRHILNKYIISWHCIIYYVIYLFFIFIYKSFHQGNLTYNTQSWASAPIFAPTHQHC